jgi:hypothetical protein
MGLVFRVLFFAPLLMLSACLTKQEGAQLRTELINTRVELDQLRREYKEDLDRISYRILSGERRIWGRLECTNHTVAEFIDSCKKEGSLSCSEQSLAAALSFMTSQAYASLYLRSREGLEGLLPLRRGQLSMLADLQFLHPSTKLLVLIQPESESEPHQREAEKLGRELVRWMRASLKVPDWVQILGPRTLPCKLKQEQLSGFVRRFDRPVLTEPTEKEGRLRIFVFRTDC